MSRTPRSARRTAPRVPGVYVAEQRSAYNLSLMFVLTVAVAVVVGLGVSQFEQQQNVHLKEEHQRLQQLLHEQQQREQQRSQQPEFACVPANHPETPRIAPASAAACAPCAPCQGPLLDIFADMGIPLKTPHTDEHGKRHYVKDQASAASVVRLDKTCELSHGLVESDLIGTDASVVVSTFFANLIITFLAREQRIHSPSRKCGQRYCNRYGHPIRYRLMTLT